MRVGRRWLLAAGLLALLLPAGRVGATPTAPVVMVNHETRQCAQVIEGDDCSWCDPLPGWEILAPGSNVSCPEGYSQVERPAMDCRRYEIPFCCSGGPHRGDCEDMVLNETTAACGFVDKLKGCALPAGWQSRPPETEPASWSCPSGYGWAAGEVACQVAAATPSPLPAPEATSTLPAEGEFEGSPWPTIWISLACLVLVAVLFGGAALFPIWYVQRQRERRLRPPKGR